VSIESDATADENPDLKLGPCCICGGEDAPIAGLEMLSVKGEVPGHGWGCLVCALPADGACAVICAKCLPGYERGDVKPRFACRGWPGSDGRVPIGELTVPHAHDPEVGH
jgi:hypothetical protein